MERMVIVTSHAEIIFALNKGRGVPMYKKRSSKNVHFYALPFEM